MNEPKIEILRSSRKTLAVEIKRDLRIIVRAPLWVSDKTIERFLTEKAVWIEKKTALVKQLAKQHEDEPKYTATELSELRRKTNEILPSRVAYFAEIMGVDFGRISFGFQRSLWGSCSASGNLSFNCLLSLCPNEVLDYVVIHELCHRKHPDHSSKFWAEVERYMPRYRQAKAWLREHGEGLIRKIPRRS